jgi:uncharacterized BrkB/YihY/UPF0761 family membrane protein
MDDRFGHLKDSVTHRYEKLEESKNLRFVVVGSKRFFEIEGLDLAGLLALELFTTIIPLVLLGYSWASDFNANLSFGDFMIKWMDLKGSSAQEVQDLFGTSADLKSTWTFLGLMGFLIWGIPMSSQVAKVFARAFRRERWGFWTEVWRGSLWFVVLLVSQVMTVWISRGKFGTDGPRWIFVTIGAIPSLVLWSVSPLILVRNGSNGWRHLAWCGLVGVVLDTFGGRVVLKWIFPKLLNGWVSFGPIGVAMALMTTATIIAALWVVTAVLGAVLWERNAPAETVIASQVERPPKDPVLERY